MRIDKYYPKFRNCLQKEEPACENTCPFHLNVFDFQDKMKRHKYDRAYKDYRSAVVFPDIVAALCPEYCNTVCPRKDYDGAVQLNMLEKTCVARTKKKEPTVYNVPAKKRKIGIIGGGVSGLACALKLREKNYEVTIFERENEIGGQLKDLLPKEVYLDDINRQFGKLEFELILNTEINNLEDISEYEFDCIYVATGNGGEDFNILGLKDGYCYMEDETAVFGGGSLTGSDVVKSIADGSDIARAIDSFLRTHNLEYPVPRRTTRVVPSIEEFSPCVPVVPTDEAVAVTGDGEFVDRRIFTDEETEAEASRCIRCQCNACMRYCDMVEYHNQWPMAMREDVSRTVASSESMVHKTPSIRLINTCTQCGLYEEMCPAGIELGEMMLEARKLLHKQNKMPPAFHGFWLDDMMHSESRLSKICKKSQKSDKCVYAFFPGCNLGAADPEYVNAPYKWLLHNFDDMGLLLRCCGVPADWSGNKSMHDGAVASLKEDWEELGKPTLIMACPSCTRHIKKYLPFIKTISIYELMSETAKWPDGKREEVCRNSDDVIRKTDSSPDTTLEKDNKDYKSFAVFDPCSARNDEGIKTAVRAAADQVGFEISELPIAGKHGCCGFGGNVEIASPEYADFIVKKRTALSELPYLTYCINCRDIFLDEGKPVLHMFDVLFGINDLDAETQGLTGRRNNRYELKKMLLKKYWGEDMTEERNNYSFDVEISDELRKKMDDLKIVQDDVMEVIDKSNKLNRRTYDEETGEYICYAKLNYITCWVRYIKTESKNNSKDIYQIKNVYTHRMFIDLEAIWNGKKVETDM